RRVRAVTEFVGTTSAGTVTPARASGSIESRQSWIAAWVTLGFLTVCFGSTLAIVVGLKPITEDLGTTRQLVALAGALTWFGTGLALIWSGQYIAGIAWPTLFERAMTTYGWRMTMVGFAVVVVIAVPIAALFLRQAPEAPAAFGFADAGRRRELFGMRPNTVLAILCIASFACCVPMAIPQGHLVAFCSDVGIPAARGAAMLSVMQAGALASRLFWGWITDRIGGLRTVLAASACQALAVMAFLTTQDEAALFAISAAYGLGFSGIIPAYIVAIRELYPSREASWRVP